VGLIDKLRGSGLKTRLLNPRDELSDRWLGIRTAGWRPHVGDEHDPAWRVEYVPTSYAVLARMFRRVGLGPRDVFVDLGAGLGRAVFAASWMGAGRAIGVEIDAELVAQARANLSRSRLRHRPIEIVEAGADTFPQEESTVIFMFNPFGAGTMRAVAGRIAEGLARNPRPLRIAYLHPFFASELDALPCLERLDHWAEEPSRRGFLSRWQRAGGWGATFWRSSGR
jgi:hypothetical protein